MVKNKNYNAFFFAVGFLVLSFSSLFFLIQSSVYRAHSDSLSMAITLDFLITIPVVYYLFIRKTTIPKFTILSVFVVSLLAASLIIPKEQHWLLSFIKRFAVPVIELGILSLVIYKVIQTLRAFKKNSSAHIDFFSVLKAACKEALPNPLNAITASEIAVFYYLFGGGKKMDNATYLFTYHKKNGVISMIGLFVFVILIETVAMHLFIDQWYTVLAWVLSLLSLYTCLQVIALARSLSKRPTIIDIAKRTVNLRYGFFNEVDIPIDQIESIELNRKTLPEDKSIVPFSPLHTFDSHNIIIHLKEPLTMNRIYGLTKTFEALAIAIDEKERFVGMIEELRISNN